MDIQDIAQNLKSRKTHSIHTPSAVLPDGRVLEMVCDPEIKETRFAVLREGEIAYEKSITLEDSTVLHPYSPKNTLI